MESIIDLVVKNQLIELFSLLTFIFFLIVCSEIFFKKLPTDENTNRKIIHLIVGILASLSPFILESNRYPILISFIFIIINLLSIKLHFFKSLNSIKGSYGIVFFPFSYLILSFFFWAEPIYILIPMLILGVSDSSASYIGNKFKNVEKYYVGSDGKTIPGTISFFIISIMITGLIFYFSELEINYIDLFIISILLSFIASISELISFRGSDNLSIPFLVVLCMQTLLKSIDDLSLFFFEYATIIIFLYYFFKKGSLSISGLFLSLLMAFFIFGIGGYMFLIPIASFFILTSLLGRLFDKNGDKKPYRDIYQVFCNGGLSLGLCILNQNYASDYIYYIYLATIASCMADSWATEIGNNFRGVTYNIMNFNSIEKGVSGGVSLYGTLGSILGASIIGIIGFIFNTPFIICITIIVSGVIGCIVDSILGATIQTRYLSIDNSKITESKGERCYYYTGIKFFNNNIINIMCTASGGIFMFLCLSL